MNGGGVNPSLHAERVVVLCCTLRTGGPARRAWEAPRSPVKAATSHSAHAHALILQGFLCKDAIWMCVRLLYMVGGSREGAGGGEEVFARDVFTDDGGCARGGGNSKNA